MHGTRRSSGSSLILKLEIRLLGVVCVVLVIVSGLWNESESGSVEP